LDATGKLLESRIGGFFVARLEAPEVAKKLDYSQDVLISAVVPVTTPLQAPQQLDKLEVSFTGFDGLQPPHSARQKVTQEGNITHLVLTRDPEPAADLLGHAAQDPNLPAEVRQALAATPFVQSDAPVLVRAARRAIGPVTDVFAASSRLQHFVFTYLHSEYVPAFSNALEAFNSRRGDCTEHSVLFVALARAVQIPARVAVGVAYWPPGRGFGWHAWAEIWVDGRWVVVDPTWDQPIADATHIKLADGGPAEQARIVMLLGQLKVTALQAQPQ
jgi:transglutaminase-like putative cysteine protease